MATRNDIKQIKRFIELVAGELQMRFGEEPTIKDCLYHLSERGIIKPILLRNYLILSDFYVQLKVNKGHITNTFYDIAIEYDMSERQIQTIVYDYQKKFNKKATIKNG